MHDLAHHRRAMILALAGAAALSLVTCTRAKPSDDEGQVGCSGLECPDGGVGENAGLLAIGAPECTTDQCGSGVCVPDVAGTLRCCEADCRLAGRVCSTAGQCVCSSQHRDVGGLCLLQEGAACREEQACASGHCVDGVCCNAPCGGICESCNIFPQVGTCSLYERDPACVEKTGFVCIERDRCRLPVVAAPLACGSDSDCDSDHCAPALSGASICCDTACSGVCERCTSTGVCGFPSSDPACPVVTSCPAKTTCLDYRVPDPNECSASGQCAECERQPARAGVACDIGAQCDGNGVCQVTGVGRVAAGTRHTCAILDNGNVRCWGDNSLGQLGTAFDQTLVGDNEEPALLGSSEINLGRKVVQITAGFAHTCVLFEEDDVGAGGRVRCWGSREADSVFGTMVGVLGTDDVELNSLGASPPLDTGDVRLSEPAVQISAANGGAHTCAVLASGKVSCWGHNRFGQCGIGEDALEVGGLDQPLAAFDVDPNDTSVRAVQVSAGDMHTCALLSDGRVSCWGAGYAGQLGYRENSERRAPQGSVAIGEPAMQIAAGWGHTCALLERGRVRCWGDNAYGALGYGHNIDIGDDETPEEAVTIVRIQGADGPKFLGGDALIGGGGVTQIVSVVEAQAVCARFSSGLVRCWGQNDQGQLGYGYADPDRLGERFPPEELRRRPGEPGASQGGDVPLGGFVVALADGGRCALVDPQNEVSSAPLELYCWGVNGEAQLGLPGFFPNSSDSTPLEMGAVNWQ